MSAKDKENALLIIFDFDGVLADSKEAYALQMQETVERLIQKKIPEEVFRGRVGNTDQKQDFIEYLQTEDDEIIAQAMDLYVELTTKYSFLRELYPGVRETLEELKKRHYIGLVSRKSQERMDDWLNHFKITHLFDKPIGTLADSKSEAILSIMESFTIQPDRTFMVGDTEFDIKSAHTAGVKSIVALYGASKPEEVMKLKPTYTLNNIKDILNIISQYE